MLIKLQQTGDTIVEVLIAIAIASLVLAGAYVASNRSLKNVRQAQEHTEALKYAESQMEQLRSAALSDPTGAVFTQAHFFCMDNGSPTSPTDATSPAVNMSSSIPTSGYTPACRNTKSVPYNAAITCVTDPVIPTYCPPVLAPGSFIFTVHISWDGVQGGTDQVTLSYKLDHQ